jgi:hypothetical protein
LSELGTQEAMHFINISREIKLDSVREETIPLVPELELGTSGMVAMQQSRQGATIESSLTPLCNGNPTTKQNPRKSQKIQ